MVMSVVGDFDLDTMEKQMTKIWASWPSAPRKTVEKPTSSFSAGQSLNYYMVRDQVILAMGNPSTLTVYDPDLVTLKMLSIICFGSLGSRLYKVREQTGLFYAAFGSFAAGASNFPGYDFVGAIVGLDKMIVAQDALKEVFANAIKQPVTQQEIDAAKHLYLKDLIDLVSSTRAIAAMHCILASLDLGFDYYDRVWKQIQTMTPEQIATVATKHIKPHALTSVRVGPVK
jgi:predicted Zn-dependent peptidase